MLKKNFNSENEYNWKTINSYHYFQEVKVFYKTHQINLRKPFKKSTLHVTKKDTWLGSKAQGMNSCSSTSNVVIGTHLNIQCPRFLN